ncbi:PRD domain-containing protein [Citrobacter farmeri]|uniref:BglG family transcription antiterminator LicT n=1 Tax=Citrobacter farmeri TaxID=67824 RepID=UPI001908B558|nr:PRD domain-containing protein [Citrobacter farmeri]MBJ9164596.1 PRD domain-containing protein [Citrobacter farmeri]
MKINRILSNNAVLVMTDKGEECVALGRGIGFGKKSGDRVDEDLIESRFHKSSGGLNVFFAEILADISPVYLKITEQIIILARKMLNIELQDTLFLALSDHVNFAVKRYMKGMNIHNQLLWEIKQFYPNEFSVGLRALDIIEEKLKLRLPDDEAGFIALHIVNAAGETNMQKVILSTEIVKDVLSIVKYDLKIDFDEQSLDYQRFITHLKFFTQRIMSKKFVAHHEISLYDDIDVKLPQAWRCARKVSDYVESHYQHTLTKDEIVFLAIHIERLRKDNIFNNSGDISRSNG